MNAYSLPKELKKKPLPLAIGFLQENFQVENIYINHVNRIIEYTGLEGTL